ncbi:uncharacterized protein LOC135375149 isoform X3 [Ornithodoros turicata]|uniref:uncharacterized protein LOC135375149 isoform X3 n=1 Tax=Ornithodoros turicata TaxID=34597 RepID=UPI00313A436E
MKSTVVYLAQYPVPLWSHLPLTLHLEMKREAMHLAQYLFLCLPLSLCTGHLKAFRGVRTADAASSGANLLLKKKARSTVHRRSQSGPKQHLHKLEQLAHE